MKNVRIKELTPCKDKRGWLAEIFRPEDVNHTIKGQFCITTAYPGAVKGNHYHKRKQEWYHLIKGKMRLVLKDMKTGEKEEIILNGDEPKILYIGLNIAHGFKNIGDEMLYLLIYNDEPYDEKDTDTFVEKVI